MSSNARLKIKISVASRYRYAYVYVYSGFIPRRLPPIKNFMETFLLSFQLKFHVVLLIFMNNRKFHAKPRYYCNRNNTNKNRGVFCFNVNVIIIFFFI